ncbi:MAG: CotH kinase family protein [Clostridiales bacterium]|nr:CotH kinase family protein [Clostridiales bacterium]
MMKKLLAVLGIAVMALPLAACSFPSDNDGDNDNKKPPVTPVTPVTPETPVTPVTPITPIIPSDPVEPGEVAVTFNAGSGAFGSGQTSVVLKPDEDGKVEFTRLPWRDGYAFTGWYNGTVKYDPDATYTSTQTFTATYAYGGEDVVYTALFNEDSNVSIAIDMSDSEWKKLNNDYREGWKSPIYRQAGNVVIGIDSGNGMLNYYYEDVGVRMKGNTSRHRFYGDDGFYNAIHMKLSFKETFDDLEDGYNQDELTDWTDKKAERDFRKARTLGGMTKIDIKYNSTLDETYIRELYAMKLFRENGIYAPNITLGSVSALNKDTDMINLGVYRIHEPVDEEFVLRHIEEGSNAGDLYKCTWGNQGWGNGSDLTDTDLDNRVGVNDELNNKLYAYEKKTNKKKDKTTGLRDFSSIKDFIRAINNSDAAGLGQYIDVDHFAKFEAINYILGNPDCIRNHANNYYLYFRKSDNKAIIIPYDYDRCLGSKQWDNYNAMSSEEITPYTRRTTLESGLQNPLYNKLIVKGAPCDEGSVLMKYRANLLEMAGSNMLKAETFNALKDKYKARYGSYTKTNIKVGDGNFGNNQSFDDNWINMSYADYINAKLTVLNNNIDNYRDGNSGGGGHNH